jgi:beta-phosphoglucomutase-like phosphatase (HAD superfamily)
MPEYLSGTAAAGRLLAQAQEFVVLENPSGHFPPQDILPLGPCFREATTLPAAILVDMDGTTTSTEDLCLHALEHMTRRFTGWGRTADWSGLDPDRDYPHIIGTSATSNVEYLVGLHRHAFQPALAAQAFLQAAAWTLTACRMPGRDREVRNDFRAMDLAGVLDEPAFKALCEAPGQAATLPESLCGPVGQRLAQGNRHDWVRAGSNVYYHVIHDLMQRIGAGETKAVAQELYGPKHDRAIVPFAGIGALFALTRGGLGEKAALLFPSLLEALPAALRPHARDAAALGRLGARFATQPAKVGLVTSSAAPEADIILHEVFAGLREEVREWPISAAHREQVLAAFDSPRAFYDVYVTASDCHEMRLKPHRDLYAVALHLLGLAPEFRGSMIGFEDTEAGILAQRAAGIGIPVAVPFHGTRNHPFQAAAHVCHGGIPEALLVHGLFIAAQDAVHPGQPLGGPDVV